MSLDILKYGYGNLFLKRKTFSGSCSISQCYIANYYTQYLCEHEQKVFNKFKIFYLIESLQDLVSKSIIMTLNFSPKLLIYFLSEQKVSVVDNI